MKAETFTFLYQGEPVPTKNPGAGLGDLDTATVKYVDWPNQRLHGEFGHVPGTSHPPNTKHYTR